MATSPTNGGRLGLPLAAPEDASPLWNGLAPEDAPEPWLPQGEYGAGEVETVLALTSVSTAAGPAELLAPAGGFDAALAAFHFGADAVYLGLKKFSARAEAENFTLAEVDEITAYAHSLTPRRRVFVTINTVIRQDELAELVEDLVHLADVGVDALILQDLGVHRLLKEHFPGLELHASTQMAVHNRAGAEALRSLGFRRAVLARELTYEEVRDITRAAGIETEVFVHGALCYAYSGLCLFSAQTLGRSGNRGKCAYSCRDAFEVEGAPLTLRDGAPVKRDPRHGFPFSMKDLALPDHMPVLRAAGVSCFKIEGRKKSPLYVATTTDYYRRLLDGRLADEERPDIEADLQTVFSRPWTRLFVHSHKEKEVADRDTVGHRGALIGNVEGVSSARVQRVKSQTASSRLRFRTRRRLERHDGLQVDLPGLGKPFGFPIDRLFVVDGRTCRETFEAPAGSIVEVELPPDHPPLPAGAPVYCSSSQAVKQRYEYARPKAGRFHSVAPLGIEATLTREALHVTATTEGPEGEKLTATRELCGPFEPAVEREAMAATVSSVFARLGQSTFALQRLDWRNDDGLFVPVSRLNSLRRDVVGDLEKRRRDALGRRINDLRRKVCPGPTRQSPNQAEFRWSLKVDRIGALDALEAADWQNVDEVIVDIARDHPLILEERLSSLSETLGKERIRLALPMLTRAWEEKGVVRKIEHFLAAGWRKWEAANLSAWSFLGAPLGGQAQRCASAKQVPLQPSIDLATDWSIYVVNRQAALAVLDMGATRFALSPEDGLANWQSLLAEFGERAVLIVHQDTPLFVAESCAYANLIGGCPGKANCSFESMQMVSSHGEKVAALDYHCRTIVLNQGPFCLSPHLKRLRRAGAINLRADFIYRPYDPVEVRNRWRLIRAGNPVPGGHAANLERGLL